MKVETKVRCVFWFVCIVQIICELSGILERLDTNVEIGVSLFLNFITCVTAGILFYRIAKRDESNTRKFIFTFFAAWVICVMFMSSGIRDSLDEVVGNGILIVLSIVMFTNVAIWFYLQKKNDKKLSEE